MDEAEGGAPAFSVSLMSLLFCAAPPGRGA